MVQAQSGVYSSKPTTSEPSKVISNVGLQAVYKVDDYKPRYELSVLNSIGSNNMSDRNLTSVRLGIQFPFGSKPKEPSAVKQVAHVNKRLPIIVIPGFVSKSDYVLQETNLGFKRNSYELDSHSSSQIKKLAEFLVLNKINIKKIEITGHADELGTSLHNKNLSNKRASVVKDILVENHVDSQIVIVTHGKGFSEPIKEFKTHHSVKNRRTEIKFIDVKISDKLLQELNDIINDTTK